MKRGGDGPTSLLMCGYCDARAYLAIKLQVVPLLRISTSLQHIHVHAHLLAVTPKTFHVWRNYFPASSRRTYLDLEALRRVDCPSTSLINTIPFTTEVLLRPLSVGKQPSTPQAPLSSRRCTARTLWAQLAVKVFPF